MRNLENKSRLFQGHFSSRDLHVNYQTDEKVDEEEWAEAKQRSGIVYEFEENMVRCTVSLRMSKGSNCVHEIWMVVWTDDFDGVGPARH